MKWTVRVKKLDKLLRSAHDGADKLCYCNATIHNRTPEFIKAVRIIQYLVQIAGIVAPMVQDTTLAGKVKALVTKLSAQAEAVSFAIGDLHAFLDGLDEAIHSLEAACDKVREDTKGLTDAVSRIGSVLRVLTPIGNAFTAVLNAIAPIRWVLDALACLIDKVFRPVIDAILRATGLIKLLEGLWDKLKHYLGIDYIIDKIESSLLPESFRQLLGGLTEAVSNVSTRWNRISECLGDFSPLGKADIGEELKKILLSLFETAIDPTKPAVIPDWPDMPPLHSGYEMCPYPARQAADWSEPEPKNVPPLYAGLVLRSIYRHPQAEALAVRIEEVSRPVRDVYPSLEPLRAAAQVFGRSLAFPQTFGAEQEIFNTYLRFAADFFHFFADIPGVPETLQVLFRRLREEAAKQKAQCEGLRSGIARLGETITVADGHIDGMLEAIPAEAVVSDALVRLELLPESLDRLLDTFDLAEVHRPDPAQRKRIEALRGELSGNLERLYGELDELDRCARAMSGALAVLTDRVLAGIGMLRALTPDGYLFPSGQLAAAARIADKLKQLDAVFQPLLLLAEVLHSRSENYSGGDILSAARKLIVLFREAMDEYVRSEDFSRTLGELFDRLLPVGKLAAALNMASSGLAADVIPQIEARTAELAAVVSRFSELLEAGMSYEAAGQPVMNKLMSAPMVEEARRLAGQIVNHTV